METVKILITTENLDKIKSIGSITRIINTLIEYTKKEDINKLYKNKFSLGDTNDTTHEIKKRNGNSP